ncbi:MAG: DUF1080 domain-containing protein [Opitutus sp.]|nr:DUF1080 domain-containing protein [Opitutus sp.]
MRSIESKRRSCGRVWRLGCLVGASWIGLNRVSAGEEILPRTVMAGRGRLIFSEDFAGPVAHAKEAPASREQKTWRTAIGKWDFTAQGLIGAQIKGEHSAINILNLSFQDAVIQFDAQVNGCNRCIFRVNDPQDGRAVGEHLCRVTLRADGLVAQKDDHDHAGPDTAVIFGEIKRRFKSGEWKTVLIELHGDEMVVTVDGETIAGRHPFLTRPKANIGFGVTGQSAAFRNLRVWEAVLRRDWPQRRAALEPPRAGPSIRPP